MGFLFGCVPLIVTNSGVETLFHLDPRVTGNAAMSPCRALDVRNTRLANLTFRLLFCRWLIFFYSTPRAPLYTQQEISISPSLISSLCIDGDRDANYWQQAPHLSFPPLPALVNQSTPLAHHSLSSPLTHLCLPGTKRGEENREQPQWP